jgi:hypothetical protein
MRDRLREKEIKGPTEYFMQAEFELERYRYLVSVHSTSKSFQLTQKTNHYRYRLLIHLIQQKKIKQTR